MTASEVLREVMDRHLRLSANGERLTVEGDLQAIEDLRSELLANKNELLAILREREPVPTATDAVLSAAALLRGGKWAPEAAPCAFFIGTSIEPKCRRCGGTWAQHTTINADATPAEQDA